MTSSLQHDDAGASDQRSAPTPDLRASDADREAVVRVLHDAIIRGLLTMEECDERVAAAYAARFLRELPPLTADLPPAPAVAPTPPGWRALAVLAWLQLRAAIAGFSWRGSARSVRARPRLALAAVALLALLSIAAVTADHAFDHDGPEFHHAGHFGPH
jgi:hypothetical protein